jgi:hypothetical protein
MLKKLLPISLALLTFTAVPALRAATDDPATTSVDEAFTEELTPLIDKTLKAYNDLDYAAFYADYSKGMEGITTKVVFDSMYKDMFFAKYGKLDIESKKLIANRSSALPKDSETYLLYYTIKAEKGGDKDGLIRLAINLLKEDGANKIMQIIFEDNTPAE